MSYDHIESDVRSYYRDCPAIFTSAHGDHILDQDDLESINLAKVDIIYHNGLDEDPNVLMIDDYIISKEKLRRMGFQGKVMHSLPRKAEMEYCLDNSIYNLYYAQMKNSKYIFQSVFIKKLLGGGC